MKKIANLLVLLLPVAAFAQNTEHYTARSARDIYAQAPSYVGAIARYSMLLGSNMTAANYANTAAGFAQKAGWNAGVEGVYFFGANLGVGAQLTYGSYGTHDAKLLAEGYKADFAVDSATVIARKGYTTLSGLAGLYLTVPLESVSFDAHVLGGYVRLTSPENTIYLEDNLAATIVQRSASGGGFGWQAGVGMRVHFSEAISAGIHADYGSARPTLAISYDNYTNNAGRKLTTYAEDLTTLNVGVGLYYNFASE